MGMTSKGMKGPRTNFAKKLRVGIQSFHGPAAIK